MNIWQSIVSLLGRVLLASMYVIAGFGKLGSGYAGTQGYMEAMGVSGSLLPLVILLELGGGLALMLGLFTRSLAVLFAFFTLMTVVYFHANWAEQTQMLFALKNISVTGGFLMLAVAGPGCFSLDARWGKRW